ncbi:MAG: hypothetical protein MRY32_07035 [Rickettsiales bacterium]|nr:hypothetical protein [Rickettsiales bacterium]
MTVSKKKYHGVYVDDDIPAFMQTGPNRLSMKKADKNGLLASSEYTLPININPSEHRKKRPASTDPTPPKAEPSALWNQGFMLSMIAMLVLVNGLLYVIFSGVLGEMKTVRLTLTSTKQEVHQIEPIEERILTFRDMNDQFKKEYEDRRREELVRARRILPFDENGKPILVQP